MSRFSLSFSALTLALCLAAVAHAPHAAHAAEVGYVEDFALAKNRDAALKQLIPGTEDYYYYHCLHYQSQGQTEKLLATLEAWKARINPQRNHNNWPPRMWEIMNRQALLDYDKNPQQTLVYLRERLNLHFNHSRDQLNQKTNYPTALDPNLLARERLTKLALQRHGNSLNGFEDTALDWITKDPFNLEARRQLLQRLQRPDYPNLVELVVADLNQRYSGGFGSLGIHRQMLLPQLEALLKQMPQLLNNTNFVNTYINKLHPNPDIDWRNDRGEYLAYLDRLWEFVGRLGPAFNSLKGHVLYHRLVYDRSQGIYDRERFMTYIALPRFVPYINDRYMQPEERRKHPYDLRVNFEPVTMLPIVGDDEPLVRSYLSHFFLEDESTKPFELYIKDVYLNHLFAEVKLVNGIGNPEQWYSMLPPHMVQAIKERIDIDFFHTNREYFGTDEPVAVDLWVKNVKSLIVKVYEVNAVNYYRDNLREVDTDINLDGLVPNKSVTLTFDLPPILRAKRHFEFEELSKPGVYVIDFIGNGKSSRLLVRKGKLRYVARTSVAGHVFTVLNEQNQHLKNASVLIAGHEFTADKDGLITVPFSNQPGRTPVILKAGDFTSLDHFNQEAENYALIAGIHVDREQVIKRRKANVLIRPGLYLNGTPVSLTVLEDVRLVINSIDLDGVASIKEVSDFKLYADRDSVYEFTVPDRLHQIHFQLKAKVQNLSQGQKVDLAATAQFILNQIDKTEKVQDMHLADTAGGYILDLFGKTGEPKAHRPINLVVKHRDFKDTINVTLQTDGNGRVKLGSLADIDWVSASEPNGVNKQWPLKRDGHSYHATVHAKVGEPIQIPYMDVTNGGIPAPSEVSLLELRGGTFAADRLQSATLVNGFLQIDDLPRGDYDLLIKDSGTRILLRLTEGVKLAGHVLSDYRYLEVRNPAPLQIESMVVAGDDVQIKLRNAGDFARVHLFATRIAPAYDAPANLSKIGDAEPGGSYVSPAKSAYVAGRSIGDEYRYILERKYMKIYPGNMLDRPNILLNPWAIRTTETGDQLARGGDDFAGAGVDPTSGPFKSGFFGSGGVVRDGVDFSNLDFLGDTSAVILNLIPDKDGLITLKRSDLGEHQQLTVVAIDPRNIAYRNLALPLAGHEFVDLRLKNGLDPARHFSEQKQITVVKKGDAFVLNDITTSKFEAYDSLARIYSLYATLTHDPKLVEFSFLLDWPRLKPQERTTLYSKYASHELNFFLSKKDPQFFAQVIQPYLANKRDKTFMDQWLLNNVSAEYLEPWEYGRLNIVEKILLGQKLQGEAANTSRHVQELFELVPRDQDRLNFLYQTALKGSALETGDVFGLEEQLEKAMPGEKLREQASRAPGAGAKAKQDGAAGGERGAFGNAAPPSAAATPAPPPAPNAPAEKPGQSDRADWKEGEERDEESKKLGDAFRRGRDYAKENLDRTRKLRAGGAGKAFDGSFFQDDAERRKEVRQYYRKLEKTQEWVENNYYKLPIEQQNANLVTVNAFWNDYAKHNPAQPFFSENFAESSRNFTDMMLAMSVIDLPFEAGKHETVFDNTKMTITAGSSMVVFHKEIKESGSVAKETPILVSQNFFRHSDRYRHENNERTDKYVAEEFLVGVVYGCQVVITNPTSSTQKLDVLLQVPVGAMAVLSGQQTKGMHIQLGPFSTQAIEYYFYFPFDGDYKHYPVHVAKSEQTIAFAQPFTFKVVNELSKLDKGSWDYISQFGTDDDVLEYLNAANLQRTNLDRIAFRMKDKPFFEAVVAMLSKRHAYNHTLFSYGLLHNSPGPAREFLEHSEAFVAQCGLWLRSTLLSIDPVERRFFEFMEYSPLVNARAHQLGKTRNIVNDRMAWQYHRLLHVLSYKPALNDADELAVTYYMLLQDRIEEAFAFFAAVDPKQIATALQYELTASYLDFYAEEPTVARGFVEKHKDHPVERWRNAFLAIEKQLDEIQGKVVDVADKENRDQAQGKLAATEPNFDFSVEAKKVNLTYQNLKSVKVNYYLMDVELLFSRNPFVQQFSGEFSYIKPNESQVVELNDKAAVHSFPLPQKFHTSNVLVEVVGGGQTKSRAYYSNAMSVQVIENYGQVRVTQATTAKPLPRTYVKVYAMLGDGQVKFYKDGYTDLRGRFDYSSLNTNELANVQKFSVLVLHDEHGAVVREAQPPKQ